MDKNLMMSETAIMEPYVIENTPNGEKTMDLSSRLLQDRIITLDGEVTGPLMASITKQLLFLNSKDPNRPIYMYINSPGGSVYAGQQTANMIDFITAPVYTICTSMAASMGAYLLSCGKKGRRFVFENSDTMLHQVSSGTEGNIQDQEVAMKQSKRLNERLMRRLAKNCGKTYAQIMKDTVRDFWMDGNEAVAYGVADYVITTEAELAKLIEKLNKEDEAKAKKKKD